MEMLSDVKRSERMRISLRLMSQHPLFLVLHISPFLHIPKYSRPTVVTELSMGAEFFTQNRASSSKAKNMKVEAWINVRKFFISYPYPTRDISIACLELGSPSCLYMLSRMNKKAGLCNIGIILFDANETSWHGNSLLLPHHVLYQPNVSLTRSSDKVHSFPASLLKTALGSALSLIWQSIKYTPQFSFPSLSLGMPKPGSVAATIVVLAPAPRVLI